MNIGLITSFAVGGLFLITILSFNQQLNSTGQEFVLNTINQDSMNEMVTLITNDFNKIGYKSSTSDFFVRTESENIVFKADAHDNDSFGVQSIRWYLDRDDPVTATTNPDDYYLKRVGPINTSEANGTLKFPVTYFQIDYFTGTGNSTTDKSQVRQVQVQVIVASAEPYSVSNNSEKVYPQNIWKRKFVPNNINFSNAQ